MATAHDPREDSIPDLVSRLIEDGRSYARAELDLLRQIARHRAGRARTGLVLVAAGGVLALSALTALI
nr:phage holin family protein [Pseudomonadota bacterium]